MYTQYDRLQIFSETRGRSRERPRPRRGTINVTDQHFHRLTQTLTDTLCLTQTLRHTDGTLFKYTGTLLCILPSNALSRRHCSGRIPPCLVVSPDHTGARHASPALLHGFPSPDISVVLLSQRACGGYFYAPHIWHTRATRAASCAYDVVMRLRICSAAPRVNSLLLRRNPVCVVPPHCPTVLSSSGTRRRRRRRGAVPPVAIHLLPGFFKSLVARVLCLSSAVSTSSLSTSSRRGRTRPTP